MSKSCNLVQINAFGMLLEYHNHQSNCPEVLEIKSIYEAKWHVNARLGWCSWYPGYEISGNNITTKPSTQEDIMQGMFDAILKVNEKFSQQNDF